MTIVSIKDLRLKKQSIETRLEQIKKMPMSKRDNILVKDILGDGEESKIAIDKLLNYDEFMKANIFNIIRTYKMIELLLPPNETIELSEMYSPAIMYNSNILEVIENSLLGMYIIVKNIEQY